MCNQNLQAIAFIIGTLALLLIFLWEETKKIKPYHYAVKGMAAIAIIGFLVVFHFSHEETTITHATVGEYKIFGLDGSKIHMADENGNTATATICDKDIQKLEKSNSTTATVRTGRTIFGSREVENIETD